MTVVSYMSRGALSVARSARPIEPNTVATSGKPRSMRSCCCKSCVACPIEIPGSAVGTDLFGRIEKDALPLARRNIARARFDGVRRLCFRQMAIAVFDHDDRRVDQNPDGEREAAERHDVGANLQIVHRNE